MTPCLRARLALGIYLGLPVHVVLGPALVRLVPVRVIRGLDGRCRRGGRRPCEVLVERDVLRRILLLFPIRVGFRRGRRIEQVTVQRARGCGFRRLGRLRFGHRRGDGPAGFLPDRFRAGRFRRGCGGSGVPVIGAGGLAGGPGELVLPVAGDDHDQVGRVEQGDGRDAHDRGRTPRGEHAAGVEPCVQRVARHAEQREQHESGPWVPASADVAFAESPCRPCAQEDRAVHAQGASP